MKREQDLDLNRKTTTRLSVHAHPHDPLAVPRTHTRLRTPSIARPSAFDPARTPPLACSPPHCPPARNGQCHCAVRYDYFVVLEHTARVLTAAVSIHQAHAGGRGPAGWRGWGTERVTGGAPARQTARAPPMRVETRGGGVRWALDCGLGARVLPPHRWCKRGLAGQCV